MPNLFWKTPKGTKALLDSPFKTEEEFERTIFETSELLEDIFLLKRQVRGGGKSGIPDIIGVDGEGNICIIELKNVEVDASIIPQVLTYAIWAENTPEAIRNLWLECDKKPENIEIEWDNLQVRIIVIAPNIHRSTLAAVKKINYRVDLLEVKRWSANENEFMLVNALEEDAEASRPRRSVSGLRTYDEAFYKTERNAKAVEDFMRCADQLQAIAKKQGWQLDRKFNRYNCVFKAGFFRAFGIGWWNSKKFGIFVKVSRSEAKRLRPSTSSYSDEWKEAYYGLGPGETKLTDLIPVFDFAYRKVAGKNER